jgi:hypothetical protein
MSPQRPTSVLVIAILNLVLGSLGSLLMICGSIGAVGAVFLAQAAAKNNPNTPPFPTPPTPLLAVQVGTMVLGLGLCVAAVVVGLGLLRMRPWARRWCIGLAAAAIAFELGSVAVGQLLSEEQERYQAASQQWQEEFNKSMGVPATPQPVDPKQAVRLGTVFGLAMAAVVIGYAAFQIVVMTRPAVVDAFERRGVVKADEF